MNNKEISAAFKLLAALSDIHGENPFKAKSYSNAAFQIGRFSKQLSGMEIGEIELIPGVGQAVSGKITNLLNGEPVKALEELINKTPPGILEMISIKGIGAKKISILWKEHEIDNINKLLEACKKKKLASIKGFGEKTQQTILTNIEFYLANQSRFLYAEVEETANELIELISKAGFDQVALTGTIRRKCEIIDHIEIIVAADAPKSLNKLLDAELIEQLSVGKPRFKDIKLMTGKTINGFPFIIYISTGKEFDWNYWLTTGSDDHVKELEKNFKKKSVNLNGKEKDGKSLNDRMIYKSAGLKYIEPEMREGNDEIDLSIKNKLPDLTELGDIKGILHVHSTYSDGQNTLKEMAEYCKFEGFDYLGITDHSKSAIYAGGLQEKDIQKQHQEIEKLNKELKPFKLFKGIESDILSDGSLDYADEILDRFDFVIISIHSGFNTTESEGTARLIKAIENPYTTILGHMTGRLLLKREGYPINHKKVIDACAANSVAIEINSNPKRLDIDWRWLQYALSKKVMISINPDAHVTTGIHDIKYGINMARKGGLSAKNILNTYELNSIQKYFSDKKNKKVGV